MSAVAIRAALETALNGMSPSLATAWEDHEPDTPALGTPWQAVYMLGADARPLEQGGMWHEEPGVFQVNLFYPLGTGPAAVETRAELIRSTFKHGSQFSASGVTVTIANVPSISKIDDPAWAARAVKIPFYANLARS